MAIGKSDWPDIENWRLDGLWKKTKVLSSKFDGQTKQRSIAAKEKKCCFVIPRTREEPIHDKQRRYRSKYMH